MSWTSHPVSNIAGSIRAPGDKSCSHRALILGGLADGQTEITGLLEGQDVLNTGTAMAALGAQVERLGNGHWRVEGVGKRGLQQAAGPIDFGNSGTGSRLMMGLVSGFAIDTAMIGDESLSGRPMARVIDPLEQMGAQFDYSDGKTLPLTVTGRLDLQSIEYTPPHASAQVKSCLLLAGLHAEGETIINEARLTRDHSEKMLRGFGAELSSQKVGEGARVSIRGRQVLTGIEARVPGDPSSAAFLAATALMAAQGGILVEGVLSNETRDGFYRACELMGARIGAEDTGNAAGERLIDMSFESSDLKGVSIPVELVPSMIDEFPILAVVAAHASGETVVSGAAELRVKESDRISAVVNMLRVNGVEVEENPDGMVIQGTSGAIPGGGTVETKHDHRIAMSAMVMGTVALKPVSIDDAAMIATSYPDFREHMTSIGADIR